MVESWERWLIPVLTADESRALDSAAVAAGTDSFDLMRRAGERLAHLLFSGDPSLPGKRVQVVVGSGNNGGDGWVAAAALAAAGCEVGVLGPAPVTPDAIRAKALCRNDMASVVENPHVVLDAMLGTGARGPLRDDLLAGSHLLRSTASAFRVAVDLPSGLDATTGIAADGCAPADLTVTFGTWKRGQLIRRDLVGELVCLDIGLPRPAHAVPKAVTGEWLSHVLPDPGALATKAERGRLLVVGGGKGMAGATILAGRGAFGAGGGMVRCYVHPSSISAVNAAVSQATCFPWPAAGLESRAELGWAHAMVIGPGFGVTAARERLLSWLEAFPGPVLLDADALTAVQGRLSELRRLREGRVTLLTPHAAEAGRLLGISAAAVKEDPFGAARQLAVGSGAVVLLKGVPTLVDTGSATFVVPRGGPILGVGGSGDLLSGIAGALLAQTGDAALSAVAAAFAHGRAGELAAVDGHWRGRTLDDVLHALPAAWEYRGESLAEHVLARLPRVAARA
ncbi:MAG: NAD(P)H-hydrate dehydratase [Gemmatimonadetes bacterium]|nr:NAD(P)H-hydrate dehydratase [Gemmatimonadota bacterium]